MTLEMLLQTCSRAVRTGLGTQCALEAGVLTLPVLTVHAPVTQNRGELQQVEGQL